MKIHFFGTLVALFISYFSFAQCLDVPTGIRAVYIEDKRSVILDWDEMDSVAGYNLFVKYHGKEDYLLWGKAGLVSNNTYAFPVLFDQGQILAFRLCSVQNYPQVERSSYSESINVLVPSVKIPMVKLNRPIEKKESTIVTWEYDKSIADLSGFVLMINNIPKHLSRKEREFDLKILPSGYYDIHILAQTKNGVLSPPSQRRKIEIN